MRRIYHHWKTWECVQAGMYSTESELEVEEGLTMYSTFLRDIPRFNAAMDRVMEEWPISCEQFLSNPSINRIAWLGQSAMCIATGVPRMFRGGFRLLSVEEQQAADAAAEIKLKEWLRTHKTTDSNQLQLQFIA